MEERKYLLRILINNFITGFILLFSMSISCNAINNQERSDKVYRNGYAETLDFSTTSNYLIVKVEKSDYDTITVVIPSEILGRYLRDDYPSDKSYAEAVIKAKKQNSYLYVSPEIYEAFK